MSSQRREWAQLHPLLSAAREGANIDCPPHRAIRALRLHGDEDRVSRLYVPGRVPIRRRLLLQERPRRSFGKRLLLVLLVGNGLGHRFLRAAGRTGLPPGGKSDEQQDGNGNGEYRERDHALLLSGNNAKLYNTPPNHIVNTVFDNPGLHPYFRTPTGNAQASAWGGQEIHFYRRNHGPISTDVAFQVSQD